MYGHLHLGGTVGLVLMAVDVTVHHHVAHDLPVPLGQRRRVPCQFSGGGGQTHHSEILGIAAGNVVGRADLFGVLLSVSRSVLGAELEDVGGTLVQARDGEMIVRAFEVTSRVGLLFFALVTQSVTHQFTHHFLRGLPLDESRVPDGGTDDHGGLARHYRRERVGIISYIMGYVNFDTGLNMSISIQY